MPVHELVHEAEQSCFADRLQLVQGTEAHVAGDHKTLFGRVQIVRSDFHVPSKYHGTLFTCWTRTVNERKMY